MSTHTYVLYYIAKASKTGAWIYCVYTAMKKHYVYTANRLLGNTSPL